MQAATPSYQPPASSSGATSSDSVSIWVSTITRIALLGATLALLSTLLWTSLQKLEGLEASRKLALESDTDQSREALYLPSAEAAVASSLGYRNVLAQLLWFNTINYFGKHYRGEKNYRWFSHMCDLVSRLNPRLSHVYPFCATLLTWEGDQPEESVRLLDRAVETFPSNWNFLYIRGFTKIYFLDDQTGGEADLVLAAQLPDAHPIIKSLAARTMVTRDGPDAAIQFLRNALRLTKEPAAREALQARLNDTMFHKELTTLQEAARSFRESNGRVPSSLEELRSTKLVPNQVLERGFLDPLGGKYALDKATGEVTSSSGTPQFSPTWNTKEERERRIAEAMAAEEATSGVASPEAAILNSSPSNLMEAE